MSDDKCPRCNGEAGKACKACGGTGILPICILIDEKIVGIWLCRLNPDCDWMAAIRELEPDQKYDLRYRVRYYKDDKIFDSEDKRSWYQGTLTGSRHYVVSCFRLVANTMASVGNGPLYEVMNEGDLKAFRQKYMSLPPIYARME